MADLFFENQGTTTYLVYSIAEQDLFDSMSLGMLTNNRIPGLAPAIFTQMDSTKYIKYNVSAKISVRQFFEGQVNKKRLLGVFNGIIDAMISAEDYMIDTNTILLDLNYIFADVSTCDTVLICLPVSSQEKNVDLLTFFKNIMFSTQFDQTENCDHVARIINYLNSTPVFSLYDFKDILDSLSRSSSTPIQQAPQPQAKPQSVPMNQSAVQPVVQATPQPVAYRNSDPVSPSNMQGAKPNPEPRHFKPEPIQPEPASIPKNEKRNVKNESISVPPANMPSAEVTQQPEASGKKITMFGLLMHYSKENKALYDSQKAAKKAAKAQSTVTSSPKKASQKPTNTGFSVPGAPSNNNFAVPGAPVNNKFGVPDTPSNTGFSVPGASVNNSYNVPKQQQKQKQASVTHPAPTAQKPVQQPVQYAQVPQISFPQGQAANFGETTVLNGGGKIGETTVLGASSPEVQIQPHLIRTKNNERINLNKPVFRIGKEKSYVDYFVSDNTAVSRSHANVISRDGQYFIVDTNSTNHTYVNGGMIQSNVETPLSHGAKIRLANEDFEFRLY